MEINLLDEKTLIINEYDKEYIVFNLLTAVRLYELNSDSANLYFFYLKNSKLQKTNKIYSTDNFCMNGLKWGKVRFYKAKKLLIDNKFIEPYVNKDDNGKIIKHYIKLHYIKNDNSPLSQKTTEWIKPPSGFQETNAYNKNINAYNKEIKELSTSVDNLPARLADNPDIEKLFNFYNIAVDNIRLTLQSTELNLKSLNILSRHKSLASKCTVSLPSDKEKAVALPLIDVLEEYLKVDTTENLIKAIDNYSTVFLSNSLSEDIYYYKVTWKSLGQFIYSGLKHNTGYKTFLDIEKLKKGSFNNLSLIDKIRKEFLPISKTWDDKNILDKLNNTYYGFYIKDLKAIDVVEDDIRDITILNRIEIFGHFEKLERAIASLLFNRKNLGVDIEKLMRLINMWQIEKDRWKKIAKSIRE